MRVLNGLSNATAHNEEICDILMQINIETGCYESIQLPEMRLMLVTFISVHMLNQQLKDNPELLKQLAAQQQLLNQEKVQNLSTKYTELVHNYF